MRAMLAAKERTPARRQRPTSLRSYSAKSPAAARLEMRHDTRPITENNSTALRNSGVRQTLDSPGQPLGESLRPAMESQFAFDFSKVRIHTDSRAAASAKSLNARAYTVGNNVVFGPGRFAPNTTEGRRLLAHELTHVVQQGARPGKVHTACSLPAVVPPASRQIQRDPEEDNIGVLEFVRHPWDLLKNKKAKADHVSKIERTVKEAVNTDEQRLCTQFNFEARELEHNGTEWVPKKQSDAQFKGHEDNTSALVLTGRSEAKRGGAKQCERC